MQFVNCKNKLKCACCEEVFHLQHKIREYSLKVDNQQSEIMYLESRVSFLLTYLNIQDQPEQCNQIINPFAAAEPSYIQRDAFEKSSGTTVHVDSQVLATSLPSGLTAQHGTFVEALKASILTPR